jgi:heme/copper-type cytochrome/quinol oxidase subunit 2
MLAAALWMCILLACAVFAVMLYSVVVYRGSQAWVRRHAVIVEVLWTAVPIAIIVTAAMPTLRQVMLPESAVVTVAQELAVTQE